MESTYADSLNGNHESKGQKDFEKHPGDVERDTTDFERLLGGPKGMVGPFIENNVTFN